MPDRKLDRLWGLGARSPVTVNMQSNRSDRGGIGDRLDAVLCQRLPRYLTPALRHPSGTLELVENSL
ncbi:hypothetical protein [Oxynema aestuarii]|uniref:Uncharacterized protein n=1 Tax=Oxynema aestuarii AP17 TaxID=2064643 RepID=A0A6H1TU85_9CYAN|nr:hypothetical protein [Oxynema aestuarii]QIZ69985.1 hypothetical protein HCG48_04835 [Oxynema aestuarii AP17]